MPSFTSSIDFKYFLNRPAIKRRLDDREFKYLNRIGQAYRMTVKRSMRSGKPTKKFPMGRSAEPKQPPRYHTKLLRDHILYQYDPRRHSVLVGPRALNGSGYKGQVPRLLEFGGQAEGRKLRVITKRDKYGNSFTRGVLAEKVRYRMRPRPFVGEQSVNWKKVPAIMNKHREALW